MGGHRSPSCYLLLLLAPDGLPHAVIGAKSTCPVVAHRPRVVVDCPLCLDLLSRGPLTSHRPRVLTSQGSVLSAPFARLDPAHPAHPSDAASPGSSSRPPIRAAPLGDASRHHLLDPVVVIKHPKLLYLHAHLFRLPRREALEPVVSALLTCIPRCQPGTYEGLSKDGGNSYQPDDLLTYIIITATLGGRYPHCTGEKSPEGLHLSKADQLIRGRVGVGWPA